VPVAKLVSGGVETSRLAVGDGFDRAEDFGTIAATLLPLAGRTATAKNDAPVLGRGARFAHGAATAVARIASNAAMARPDSGAPRAAVAIGTKSSQVLACSRYFKTPFLFVLANIS
jgi:hypothetical protein